VNCLSKCPIEIQLCLILLLYLTQGPHDKHMTEKLNQMDIVLSTTLEVLDTSNKCHLALIFGDHGMTEDGCVLGNSGNIRVIILC
jgi:predicted AlkP superfamily pyrophosphatase or phosphodiesterase